MRVTLFTEYSFKVLLYLARNGESLVRVGEIARVCGMSKSHLVKVIQNLAHSGFIITVRGKNGGVSLGSGRQTSSTWVMWHVKPA